MTRSKKVSSIYVCSATMQSIGKTALCLGLAQNFLDEGVNVGYFKPVGWNTTSLEGKPLDEDTIHMKEILNLEEPLESITPVLLDYQYLDQHPMEDTSYLLERIVRAYQHVALGKDLIVIDALNEPGSGASLNISAAYLARKFGSHLILLTTTHRDTAVDEILFKHSCISKKGTRCDGAIFNQVRSPIDDRIRNVIVPILKKQGIRVWGLIPESIALTAPTVEELVESMGGEVLCGEESLSNLVERYLIGAMTQETAIRYLRRTPKKAVIAGGDRPDIALAALETDTSALILTGNIHPNSRVLSKAKEKGVPIILVPYDTYTAVNRVRDVTGKIRAGDSKRINEAKRLVSKYVDWKELLSCIL